jgi:hypothetical protein
MCAPNMNHYRIRNLHLEIPQIQIHDFSYRGTTKKMGPFPVGVIQIGFPISLPGISFPGKLLVSKSLPGKLLLRKKSHFPENYYYEKKVTSRKITITKKSHFPENY